MPDNHYTQLLNNPTQYLSSETFARHALGLLEADLRQFALRCLQGWLAMEIVSPKLFPLIVGLQRPTWGYWNGLINALYKARQTVLQTASAETQQKIEHSSISKLFEQLRKSVKTELTSSVLHDFYQCIGKQKPPRQPSLQNILAAPIYLRNRIAHDNPTDTFFWEHLASVLRPLVQWLSQQTLLNVSPTLNDSQNSTVSNRWFLEKNGQLLTYNGINAKRNTVIYIDHQGVSCEHADHIHDILFAFKQIMGRPEQQEQQVLKLLGKLAPESLKGVLMSDYLVGSFVGKGSHGQVHKGMQLSTGRQVALKFLQEHLPDEVKHRFKQEATFLSRLNHPHIVNVLGYVENESWQAPKAYALSKKWYKAFSNGNQKGGFKTFIVMEWIEGETLDDYYNKQKAHARPADFEQLTQWFIDATTALAHVHQSTIIHRDIKPSNLMLTEQNQLKLMDFGIARRYKVNNDTRLTTDLRSVLGTPAYMSPEQMMVNIANDHIGPATDIYGLSAVFYELYTQSRLYNHDEQLITIEDLIALKTTLKKRPLPAMTVNKKIPWELSTILQGGLENEVIDRYQDISDLKRDLVCYLNNEPIHYQLPSLLRRTQLAYRRNRRASIIAFAALSIITVLTTLYISEVTLQRDKADKSRQQAERLIEFINVDLRQKLKPIGRLDLMEDVQQNIDAYFQQSDLPENDATEQEMQAISLLQHVETLALQGKVEQALQTASQASEILLTLIKRDSNQLRWQHSQAISLIKRGRLYKAKGAIKQAKSAYQEALAIRQKLVEREPDSLVWQHGLLSSYHHMGDIYSIEEEVDKALNVYQQALNLNKKLIKANQNIEWQLQQQSELALTHDKMGGIHKARKHYEKATKSYQHALDIRQMLTMFDDKNFLWKRDLYVSFIKRGDMYQLNNETKYALNGYQLAINIAETLTKRDAKNLLWQHDLSVGYEKIAKSHKTNGDNTQAMNAIQAALEIRKILVKHDPQNLSWQQDLSVSYDQMGDLYKINGELDKANAAYQTALGIRKIMKK